MYALVEKTDTEQAYILWQRNVFRMALKQEGPTTCIVAELSCCLF
jgi:hypothetical protein